MAEISSELTERCVAVRQALARALDIDEDEIDHELDELEPDDDAKFGRLTDAAVMTFELLDDAESLRHRVAVLGWWQRDGWYYSLDGQARWSVTSPHVGATRTATWHRMPLNEDANPEQVGAAAAVVCAQHPV